MPTTKKPSTRKPAATKTTAKRGAKPAAPKRNRAAKPGTPAPAT